MTGYAPVYVDNMRWRDHAACIGADPTIFYPDNPRSDLAYAAARAFCDACPVVDECLAMAIAHRDYEGFVGNTTPSQRRKLPTQRRYQPCPSTAAYRRHLRDGETPCAGCMEANRVDMQHRRPRVSS